MKKAFLLFAFSLMAHLTFAQSSVDVTTVYEWNLNSTAAGERVVAYINSGTIGQFTGAALVGQIVDGNSNWGYLLPTVANFKVSVNFSNSSYQLQQDVATADITLELKSISATQVAIIANCPIVNKQMRIFLRYTTGFGPSITMGTPSTIFTGGTPLISQPTYTSTLTGQLLLNTTNSIAAATYALAVGGKAIAESMTVKLQSNWPDYVFNTDYSLTPLNKVKRYIDLNHHLPELPSEQQISNDGLNLGEIDELLTKKVEELTLYLIEKDKQLQEQRDAAIKQQGQIDEQNGRLKVQQQEIDQLKQQVQILLKNTPGK